MEKQTRMGQRFFVLKTIHAVPYLFPMQMWSVPDCCSLSPLFDLKFRSETGRITFMLKSSNLES